MDDERLRESVRGALQAADDGARLSRTPAFAALWQAAQQPTSRTFGWRAPTFAASVALLAIVAVFTLRMHPPGDAPGNAPGVAADADLLLAQQLTASDPWRVPTDRLLEAAPASLATGAPPLPEFQYPLLPKERYL